MCVDPIFWRKDFSFFCIWSRDMIAFRLPPYHAVFLVTCIALFSFVIIKFIYNLKLYLFTLSKSQYFMRRN